MAVVQVNGLVLEAALIAFDKDGTLVDFHYLWSHKTEQWVEDLLRRVNGDHEMRHDLFRSLGYDPSQKRVVGEGPLAVAAMPKLCNIATTVLYQHGLPWYKAEREVQDSVKSTMGKPPDADEIRPIGNVSDAMHRMAAAGIKMAIITSDDRAAVEATLPLLGVQTVVNCLISGDDNLPNKPDPAGFYALKQQFNLDLAQMMMVGDTVNDMVFARNAGVGCCVGIAGGAGDQQALTAHADVVVSSIDAIQVLNSRG